VQPQLLRVHPRQEPPRVLDPLPVAALRPAQRSTPSDSVPEPSRSIRSMRVAAQMQPRVARRLV